MSRGNQRFSIAPSRAVSDENMPDGIFRTLSAIGVYGDKNGWCFPSLSTLAKDRNISKPAVSQHIKWLKENGYLIVHARYNTENGNASRRSNRYQIKFDYADTEEDDVLSSELNTPLSSELNTPLSSELNVNALFNVPKERKEPADFFKLTESASGKIQEIENMISKVKRVTGWSLDTGGNGKGERALKKLIDLEKSGTGDLEQFWRWNTSDAQKFDCLRYSAFAKDPTLLSKWVEDRAGEYMGTRESVSEFTFGNRIGI